jgi:hypothetical protein
MARGDEMEIRAVFGTLKYNKNNMLWEITRCAYHWQMSAIREGKERKDLGYLCVFKSFSSRVFDSRTKMKV